MDLDDLAQMEFLDPERKTGNTLGVFPDAFRVEREIDHFYDGPVTLFCITYCQSQVLVLTGEEREATFHDSVLIAIEKMMPADRRSYLNNKSIAYADKMMQRWDKLAKYLIVKYNDQVVKSVDKDGNFQRWGNETPGYDQQFINAIGKSTGERYKLKKVIERRER